MNQNTPTNPVDEVSPWTPELLQRRRRRAAIMAVALLIWVGMFFWVTLVRLSHNVVNSGVGM